MGRLRAENSQTNCTTLLTKYRPQDLLLYHSFTHKPLLNLSSSAGEPDIKVDWSQTVGYHGAEIVNSLRKIPTAAICLSIVTLRRPLLAHQCLTIQLQLLAHHYLMPAALS